MAYCVCFGNSPATNGAAVLAMADVDQILIYFGIPLKRSALL
jgi:hypothetical protein